MALSQQLVGFGTGSTMKIIGNDLPTSNGSEAASTSIGLPTSKVQDVRVDNWGHYCLQRLGIMYEKGEYCDLILQCQNLQIIKVHRVVVNMCTDYFASLEASNGLTDGMLVLPKEIEYNSMLVIIRFFYTGKLEVRGAEFSDVYRTVKLLSINILTKLLEAHARKPEEIPKRKPAASQLVIKPGGQQVLKSLVHTGLNAKTTTVGLRKPLAVGRGLTAGVKTKTVLARVQQQPVRLTGFHSRANIRTSAPMLPKKLPIWKERKTIIQAHDPPKYITQKVEPARPTRFEWPDPDEDLTTFKFEEALPDDFTGQSQIPAPSLPQKAALIFDAVKTQVEGVQPSGLKHKLSENNDDVSSKMAKISDEIEKELASMEAPDEAHETAFEASMENDMQQILRQGVSDHEEVETSVEVTTTEPELILNDTIVDDIGAQETVESTPIKRVSKSVRFATDVEKENKEANELHTYTPAPVIQCTSAMIQEEPANHSKLISEILKRYPGLIKDNKNVKLKIVQKGPPEAGSKEAKSKTSYIVLKSSSSDTPGSVVLKKSSSLPVRSKFWDTDDTVKKVSNAAENTLGPWSCLPCGTPDAPEHFDSYYLYRKHLVEVHHEKVDARICEYCGIKTSKRNLLLYHLYTKHAIEPPPSHQFPHCDQCDYVALSWSLLQKHKQSHASSKLLTCSVCRASFKTNAALQYHIDANLHRNRDSKGQHQCPYCPKQFARVANLNTHIRVLHKDVAEEFDDESEIDSQQYQVDEETKIEMDELMANDESELEIIDGTHISIPTQVLPSSEAGSLINVASSIAASLCLGSQIHQGDEVYAEHILGDTSQQVFVLENTTTITPDAENGERALDISEMEGDFLVQDIHGNKFRKITGTDSEGNPVVFFQLTDENGEVPTAEQAVEISEEVATTVANHVEYCFDEKSTLSVQNDHMYLDPQKCSIFLSSGSGVPVPVTLTSEEIEQTQTLISYAEDGTQVIELLPMGSEVHKDEHSQMEIIHPETEEENPTEEGTEGEEVMYEHDAMEGDEVHEHEVVEIMEETSAASTDDGTTGV